MTRIHINASTPYDVVIEEGALQRITDYIKPLKPNCRVIIVSDSNVAPHYLDSVKANMEHAGYVVCDYVFPAGESSKNAHQLIDLVEYMAGQSRSWEKPLGCFQTTYPRPLRSSYTQYIA